MQRKTLFGLFLIAILASALVLSAGTEAAANSAGFRLSDVSRMQFLASAPADATITPIGSQTPGNARAALSINSGQPCNPACIAQDNGSGTVDLPASCLYSGLGRKMYIIDGLPAGTTVEIDPILQNFTGIVRTPGGSLGGEKLQFNADLQLTLTGTGSLGGYSRTLTMTVAVEIDNAPHGTGPSQSFAGDLVYLQGQITGDPDFDLLRIAAGTGFGMPSPGHTTLVQQSGGTWLVDSFFDITYQIDFVGKPGSVFAGHSGSTTATIRMDQGHHFWATGDPYAMHFPQLPDPMGWDVYGVNPMLLGDDWLCTASGDVKDIHFWGSWLNDVVGVISSFDISIRADVPAGVDLPYSHPGDLMWQKNITNFCELPVSPPSSEGWYDPSSGIVLPSNHMQYFQYDVTLDQQDWFSQTSGIIYWLCISANVATPGYLWGWKSTQNHYNDDAVWLQPGQPVCPAQDNGTGTIDLPANCIYSTTNGTFDIINGLPPGSTINSQGHLGNFFNVTRTPGGPLGGEVDDYQASLQLLMTGTGALGGFNRNEIIPIGGGGSAQMAHGPRTPGMPIQDFPSEMFRLQGQLPPGDPDFDLLRITGGTDFGMPSPGHTTLTKAGGGTWNVESFFDIFYRIDFVGAPGGPLAGMSGSTTGTVRIYQGGPPPTGTWIDMFEPPAFTRSLDLAFVITDGSAVAPCDCMPGDADGSGVINVSDAVYLVAYVFNGAPAPKPYAICSGDADCNCIVNISDVVYLVGYIFAGGPGPCSCTEWLTRCGAPLRN